MLNSATLNLCSLMLGVCLAAAAAGGETTAETATGSRWAILVGVNDYAKLRPLEYAVSDMRALAEQLKAGGFQQDHVYVLTDKAEKAALLPTKRNIEERLDLVLSLVKPNDMVLVAFAGHGVEVGQTAYWCPTDAVVDGTADEIDDTLVSVDSVYKKLGGCEASLRLIVADACRDDPRRERSSVPMKLDVVADALANPPDGILVLSSCGSREKSQEDSRFGHGVFTHFLLDGLRGSADADGDGRVVLSELFEHAGTKTKKYVADEFAAFQSPKLSGEVSPGVLGFPITTSSRVVTNSIGLKLVRIKAGQFTMGSKENAEQLRNAGFVLPEGYDPSDEQPMHLVRISKPFLMGQTEVTLGQFLRFYHDGFKGKLDCEKDGKGGWGYDPKSTDKPLDQKPKYRPWTWGHPSQTNEHPVVNVSWNDAVAFCEWLSRKEGKRYRLPREAEWEYACRAGTTTRFWNGDDPEELATVGNVADGTAKATFPGVQWAIKGRDGHIFTTPAGSFDRPNPFGLHDIHGNVYEWCSDWYDKGSYAKASEVDPKGPVGPSPAGSFRVLRGGSWYDYPVSCRSALRHVGIETYRNYDVGFRVLCELE